MSGSEPRSGGGDDRPGAAFGIPEGATGEEVVDAVLGAIGSTGSDGSGGRDGRDGIDPELLPYLEAAGTPNLAGSGPTVSGLHETEAQQEADAEIQDREDLEALRELVAAT